MREIKFRAWFAKERKMVDVKQIDFFGGRLGKTHATIHAETDFEKGGWFSKLKESTNRNTSLPNSNEQIKRVNLMQYTGMEDSKGNEIYEGDIVRFPFREYDEDCVVVSPRVGYVRFTFGQWSVRIKENNRSTNLYGTDSRKIEIIGNIHDNPELLEGDNA